MTTTCTNMRIPCIFSLLTIFNYLQFKTGSQTACHEHFPNAKLLIENPTNHISVNKDFCFWFQEGLSISVKLGHKDIEFDAANTEEKLTICSLLGIVKGGDLTSQQVQCKQIVNTYKNYRYQITISNKCWSFYLQLYLNFLRQVWMIRFLTS